MVRKDSTSFLRESERLVKALGVQLTGLLASWRWFIAEEAAENVDITETTRKHAPEMLEN